MTMLQCISQNLKQKNVRNRYVDIKYKFVCELYYNGWFDILHVSTKKNVADLLTKSLPKDLFLSSAQITSPIFEKNLLLVFLKKMTKRLDNKNDNPDLTRHPNEVT